MRKLLFCSVFLLKVILNIRGYFTGSDDPILNNPKDEMLACSLDMI
jgi:hypothetical protein